MPADNFNPDNAAAPGSGIFGLPFDRASSRIVLLPVPFDATTSYRKGTANGPEAIAAASHQVDLLDRQFGKIYQKGIFMEEPSERIKALNAEAAALAQPLIDKGGAGPGDEPVLEKINAICERVNAFVREETAKILAEWKIPGIVGGEHSVPFGAIDAIAERHGEIGILHIDAHMDLREAFEGFEWSHASIMYNVMTRLPKVKKLISIGIRDFGETELAVAESDFKRIHVHYDDDWEHKLLEGKRYSELAHIALAELPHKVYISFDIDGLDPALCPHTGTPVPGGLSFHQAMFLLRQLHESGREIVGFDLVEVAPGREDGPEWDANVGARVLYKLCGAVR